MRMNRRDFIGKSAIGAGALLLGRHLPAAEPRAPAGKFDPYAVVPLGKSGLKITRTCIGTGMRGGRRQSNHTRMGQEKFTELVRGAYDKGARCFDLADLYGTHPFFAKAMKGVPRDSFTVITKIWTQRGGIPEEERPGADVVINRFLKELETDYVDLVLMHCMTADDWTTREARNMELMAEMKKKGMIRAHGVSCHSVVALEAAAASPWVDSVHARINPYGDSMDDKPEVVIPVIKKLHEAGKGVVAMKVIGEGRYRNDDEKKDASIKYSLTLGCVDILNVGCENMGEVNDLVTRIGKTTA